MAWIFILTELKLSNECYNWSLIQLWYNFAHSNPNFKHLKSKHTFDGRHNFKSKQKMTKGIHTFNRSRLSPTLLTIWSEGTQEIPPKIIILCLGWMVYLRLQDYQLYNLMWLKRNISYSDFEREQNSCRYYIRRKCFMLHFRRKTFSREWLRCRRFHLTL